MFAAALAFLRLMAQAGLALGHDRASCKVRPRSLASADAVQRRTGPVAPSQVQDRPFASVPGIGERPYPLANLNRNGSEGKEPPTSRDIFHVRE